MLPRSRHVPVLVLSLALALLAGPAGAQETPAASPIPVLDPALASEEACRDRYPDAEQVRYERRDGFIGCSYATVGPLGEVVEERHRVNRRGTIRGTLLRYDRVTSWQGIYQHHWAGELPFPVEEWMRYTDGWVFQPSWFRERYIEPDHTEWASCTRRGAPIDVRICERVLQRR